MSGTYLSEYDEDLLVEELIRRLETGLIANGPDLDVEDLLIKLKHYHERSNC